MQIFVHLGYIGPLLLSLTILIVSIFEEGGYPSQFFSTTIFKKKVGKMDNNMKQ